MSHPSSPNTGNERPASFWSVPELCSVDLDAVSERLRDHPAEGATGFGGASWAPASEECETAEAYQVRLELPGVPRDRVSIDVEGRQLHVHGDLLGGGADRFGCLESRSGHFGYRTSLPADADPEGMRAGMASGILTVTVPRVGGESKRAGTGVTDFLQG